MQYDRPGVFAVAAICFAIVLVRCWWLVRRDTRAAELSLAAVRDQLAADYLRRIGAAERSLN